MAADTTDIADLAWFRRNPQTNFRVRAPRVGEVDELARDFLPADLDWDGAFAAPAADTDWRVMAIRLPMRRVARMLTLAAPGADGGFHVMPVALGERLAIGLE